MEGESIIQLVLQSQDIAIRMDNDLKVWTFSSFLRGYHAYMDIWVPLIGDDSLTCQKEHGNMHDHHAVAIKQDGRTVGHIPKNMTGFIWRFLCLPNTSVRVEVLAVLGPRMNRGAGHGLEVPVNYRFLGHQKAVDWVAEKIKEEDNKLTKEVQKCLKNAL